MYSYSNIDLRLYVYTTSWSSSYDLLGDVIINPIPSEYIIPSGSTSITTNGTHDVSQYSSAVVNVPAAAVISDTTDVAGGTIRSITTAENVYLQTKTITPSSTAMTVEPDTGYNRFSSVTVNPPNLTTKTGSASEYTEVVTPYTVLRTVSYTSAVSQRTPDSANTYSSFGVDFYPE